MPRSTPGYSGTPLVKKLGIKEGFRILSLHAPDEYLDLLAPVPAEVSFDQKLSDATDLVHVFSTRSKVLRKDLARIRKGMRGDAVVWVSWPKKASKVETDITEDAIRQIALPMGLVDVKVCAVTEIWSGLKLVIRTELR
jgi:hypothetical protein